MIKVLLFVTVWLFLLCLIGYGSFKYMQYKDEIHTQRLKAEAERDMKELEHVEKMVEVAELEYGRQN